MNYVSIENAFPSKFMSTAFEPEYVKSTETPSYEDIVVNEKDINPGNIHESSRCGKMMNHMKVCIHCREKLKKIIAMELDNEDTIVDISRPRRPLRRPRPIFKSESKNILGFDISKNTFVIALIIIVIFILIFSLMYDFFETQSTNKFWNDAFK